MNNNICKTIDQQQDEIIAAFALISDDQAAMLDYLMELGAALPPILPQYKTDAYLVPGCMSKVWLATLAVNGKLVLQADSNTAITKGLMALLIKICSGQPLAAILHADLYFVEAIGIHKWIGAQRSSGLSYMIKAIKLAALCSTEAVTGR